MHKKRGGKTWACQGGCCKQSMSSRRQRKREKVAVGPGPRQCKAGDETKICGKLRLRWGGLCALGNGGAENGRAKAGVANRVVVYIEVV